MIRPHHLLIVFILIMTVVACAPTPPTAIMSTSLPTTPKAIPIITEDISSSIEPSQTEVSLDTNQDNSIVLENNHMNI